MEFTFVMAYSFNQYPACKFNLTVSFWILFSVVNRLIQPERLSLSWLVLLSVHSKTKERSAMYHNVSSDNEAQHQNNKSDSL